MRIEIIGVEPPCRKCKALLKNAKKAVEQAGVNAEVVKLDVLSAEVIDEYGLLLVPALVIDGVVVSQRRVLSVAQIVKLIQGR